MIVSIDILGVWGPYKSALFPDFYLHEGGQSATGFLLDFIVKNHPAYSQAAENAKELLDLNFEEKHVKSSF